MREMPVAGVMVLVLSVVVVAIGDAGRHRGVSKEGEREKTH